MFEVCFEGCIPSIDEYVGVCGEREREDADAWMYSPDLDSWFKYEIGSEGYKFIIDVEFGHLAARPV